MVKAHATLALCFLLCWTEVFSRSETKRQIHGPGDVNLNELQAVVDNLSEQVEENVAKIRTLETKLQNSRNAVAFHAEFRLDPVHLGPSDTLVLDNVVTNVGGCYNASTGEFVVPLTGTYMFIVNFMGDKDTSTYINLMVDNTTVDYSISHGDGMTWDHVSESVVLNVAAEQRVWLRHGQDTRDIRGYHWTTFSGFLISPNL